MSTSVRRYGEVVYAKHAQHTRVWMLREWKLSVMQVVIILRVRCECEVWVCMKGDDMIEPVRPYLDFVWFAVENLLCYGKY
jgi:hypothetical protein